MSLREKSAPPTLDSVAEAEAEKLSRSWYKWSLSRFERDMLILSTGIKVLLFPAYRSTDFEVHRNWLAITHSLPLARWYLEATSEWTLDYPPFFAYFEWLLSLPASLVDPKMLLVDHLNYDAWSVVLYQRTTVLVSELVMGAALLKLAKTYPESSQQRLIYASLFIHPGLLIVDHIHFQYNSFLFGILLWSLYLSRSGSHIKSGLLFAALLNFKHIYIYLAPAYFVYLLRAFCTAPNGAIRLPNLLMLGNAVILTFTFSLAPFAILGQLPQLFSRLFPFTRGLNHAYWAPNFWALVTFVDRALLYANRKWDLGFAVKIQGAISSSRGLIGDTVFAILPDVRPPHTFILTLALQMIFLAKLWRTPSYTSFVTALVLCGYVSFLFGWHVHEKAILLVLVPFSIIALRDYAYFRTFVIATISGVIGLFPLIFTPLESIVKIIATILWIAMIFTPLEARLHSRPTTIAAKVLDLGEKAYLWSFVPLQAFALGWPFVAGCVGGEAECKNEFLPLMVTSVHCSLGVCWSFIRLSYLYLLREK